MKRESFQYGAGTDDDLVEHPGRGGDIVGRQVVPDRSGLGADRGLHGRGQFASRANHPHAPARQADLTDPDANGRAPNPHEDAARGAPPNAGWVCSGVESPRRCRLVQIRHATLRDLDDVITVREAALSRHAPDVYSEREVDELVGELDETDLQRMISGGRLFVSERGGQILDTAGWTNSHLPHVHVRPGDERAGIGTQLVRRIEADFLRSGLAPRFSSTRLGTRRSSMRLSATRDASNIPPLQPCSS